MIIKCTCQHEGQDKLHGKGMRVANPTVKKDKQPHYHRCTVCGVLHEKRGEE